jgi:hypothetical protein
MSEANQIEGVPEGWRLVGFRQARHGEDFLGLHGFVTRWNDHHESTSFYPIVERIEPKPKYRPFANAEEFMKHPRSGDWVTDEGFKFCKILLCRSNGIRFDGRFLSYESAVDELKFLDGTPFGIEVKE